MFANLVIFFLVGDKGGVLARPAVHLAAIRNGLGDRQLTVGLRAPSLVPLLAIQPAVAKHAIDPIGVGIQPERDKLQRARSAAEWPSRAG